MRTAPVASGDATEKSVSHTTPTGMGVSRGITASTPNLIRVYHQGDDGHGGGSFSTCTHRRVSEGFFEKNQKAFGPPLSAKPCADR